MAKLSPVALNVAFPVIFSNEYSDSFEPSGRIHTIRFQSQVLPKKDRFHVALSHFAIDSDLNIYTSGNTAIGYHV